jgi:hypothetical protein
MVAVSVIIVSISPKWVISSFTRPPHHRPAARQGRVFGGPGNPLILGERHGFFSVLPLPHEFRFPRLTRGNRQQDQRHDQETEGRPPFLVSRTHRERRAKAPLIRHGTSPPRFPKTSPQPAALVLSHTARRPKHGTTVDAVQVRSCLYRVQNSDSRYPRLSSVAFTRPTAISLPAAVFLATPRALNAFAALGRLRL